MHSGLFYMLHDGDLGCFLLDGYFRTDSALIEAKLQLIMNKHELDKKLSQIWM